MFGLIQALDFPNMLTPIYIKKLNGVMSNFGFGHYVKVGDLSLTSGVVSEPRPASSPIAYRLWDHVSPAIRNGEFYHFTSEVSATSIFSDPKKLWLACLKKRVNEHELGSFLHKFGFDYPLETDPTTGEERYKGTLAESIFYTSFTDTNLSVAEEDRFWSAFGDNGRGARLKFTIHSDSGILRRMRYGDDIDHWGRMVTAIRDLTAAELGAVFHWQDSHIFACLLLPIFLHERETRLAVSNKFGLRRHSSSFDYVEIPLAGSQTLGLRLKLNEVKSNLPLNLPPGTTRIPV